MTPAEKAREKMTMTAVGNPTKRMTMTPAENSKENATVMPAENLKVKMAIMPLITMMPSKRHPKVDISRVRKSPRNLWKREHALTVPKF